MSKNVLDILSGSDLDTLVKERIMIYGRAGVGKTRFGLSVPEHWGKIAYYAADKNSWLLRSISRAKRDRIHVIRPRGDDPTALFMQFCMMDWDEVDPEIGTIVVDTYSKVALDSISFTANSMTLDREKHYVVGDIGKGGIAIPNRGDYQGVDGLSKNYLDMIFDKQLDKHIIFLCHEESKQVEGMPAVGGPQHPGRQMIDYLPAQFSTVIRLVRDEVLVPGADDVTPVVVAITENDGKYVAKLRTDDEEAPNPLAKRVLDRNPSSWWVEYENYQNGRVAVPVKKKKKSVAVAA
jgi:AAA domain-containing protein